MKRLLGLGVVALAVAFSGTAIAADGAALFKAKCSMCHGLEGQGSAMGAKMQGNEFIKKTKEDELSALLKSGRAGAAKKYKEIKMDMPKQVLNDDETKAVIAHIKGIASK
ncbi:MAG: cytochrome c [Deltaproteobacteria bacterium]|nr:cytochrome c [Deltaproteobacteria bacterium]